MSIAKNQLQQIIAENNITSVPDVYSFFKENFKAMLQELLEAEMEASIDYEKNEKQDADTDNKRNGIPPRPSKASMVNSR